MTFYVCMTDSFMSHWGRAAGKTNIFCVACDTYAQADRIESAARSRSEMKRVRIQHNPPRPSPSRIITHKRFSELGSIWTGA